jgi:hypothetical protein
MSDERWAIRIEPAVLLPGRQATATATYTPDHDHESRRVTITLRCVERYRYDRREPIVTGKGVSGVRTVTHTGVEELVRLEVEVAGPTRFKRSEAQTWNATFEVPGLGPASFEGEALRCDWTLEAKVDVAMSIDEGVQQAVAVAQPMALLRAGVLDTGMYGLFDEAPVNQDAHPAQVSLAPVPICLQAPFTGSFTVETAKPIEVQEVRLELSVQAEVTVPGGHREEITVWRGGLPAAEGAFGGNLTRHAFQADAPGAWTPSVDLPHGRARGQFHVILALAWEPDIHYIRDVALATTSEL